MMVNWISVNDVIPEAFVSVLLYMPKEAPLPTVHEGYYANGKWYWNIGQLDDGDVTYWAPMPEGPCEDTWLHIINKGTKLL